ncbi:MAG: AAA family ATPase [Armatimonadota bacterium]
MTQNSKPGGNSLLQIRPTNLLSFGLDTPALELNNLNVLIGANGSGKSNLIEMIALMRATPVWPQTTSSADVRGVVRRGGGVSEWIWKGAKKHAASIELVVDYPTGKKALRHRFAFRNEAHTFRLDDETIENQSLRKDHGESYYYRFMDGHPVINAVGAGNEQKLTLETFDLNVSILAQRRDPVNYPEITYLADTYEKIRIYREWAFGRNTVFREPQKADMRNDYLEEDFSNLGLFLSRLFKNPTVKRSIIEKLSDIYDSLSDLQIVVEGGSVQVFITEGNFSIPATRLSDGTLRYLCLLAILCDPEPPPLICIEEPELGLHPDIMPKIADLLIEASQRTQIIVTTHSDILVDSMTECPEAIIVCEKHAGCTQMSRLNSDDLAGWLGKYRLGELWTSGQIGGTRW